MSAVKFKVFPVFLMLFFSGVLIAQEAVQRPGESSIDLMLSEEPGAEIQLEVRQASLGRVLGKIEAMTGTQMHYSVLPEGLVTATCVGSTVRQAVECLFDRKADLVFQNPRKSAKKDQNNKPAEIWVLGTNFNVRVANQGQDNSEGCSSIAQPSHVQAAKSKAISVPSEADEIAGLIKLATAKDPVLRANAISGLMAKGQVNDIAVHETLLAALADKDATVRAQAVSSLAHREGSGANAVLQDALHDSDASVRLMAVDNAGDNSAILQQALTDSDETIRVLAAMKLEWLAEKNFAR